MVSICYFLDFQSPLGLAASAAFTLALAVLLFAIVGALFGRGSRRIFWAGFALFGWAYLLSVFGPRPINIRYDLVTQKALERLPAFRWHSAIERQIKRDLEKPITLELKEVPIEKVFDSLRNSTHINFVIDRIALEEEGVTRDTPVTLQVEQIPLGSSLNLILGGLALTYEIESDVVQVTSELRILGDATLSGDGQHTGHGLLTLLIAFTGGWLARICFGERPLTKPQFSLRLLIALPVVFALLFAFARWVGFEAASVISICVFGTAMFFLWGVLGVRARLRPGRHDKRTHLKIERSRLQLPQMVAQNCVSHLESERVAS